jgi:predicted nucleotidyltransferase
MSQEFSVSPEAMKAMGIRVGYLFGSRAAGRPSARSDADVAVLLRDEEYCHRQDFYQRAMIARLGEAAG